MKKLLCLLIAFAIIINSCGYVLIYRGIKQVYKFNFLTSITSPETEKKLKHLVISKEDALKGNLQRVERDEIKYYGCMYDIVKEFYKDETLHVYCVSDENEDYLNKYFEESYKNNTDRKADKNPLINIFKLAFSFALPDEHYSSECLFKPGRFLSPVINIHSTVIKETLTPPPRVCS